MEEIPELGQRLTSRFLQTLPLKARIAAEYIVNMAAAGFIGYIFDKVLFDAFDIWPQSTLIMLGIGFLAASWRSYLVIKGKNPDEDLD